MAEQHSIFTQLRGVLRDTYFFQALKVHELDELIGGLRMIRVQEGYEIIRQGDPGDAFYLIASGRVSVWVKKGFRSSKADDSPCVSVLTTTLLPSQPVPHEPPQPVPAQRQQAGRPARIGQHDADALAAAAGPE